MWDSVTFIPSTVRTVPDNGRLLDRCHETTLVIQMEYKIKWILYVLIMSLDGHGLALSCF